MGPAKLTAPRIRELTLDDYPRVRALEAQCGISTKDCADWRHLWSDNPVYHQVQDGWPIGWVLETAGLGIVGSVCNVPLAYEFEGQPLLVAAGRAWVADSRFRPYSVLLLEHYFSQTGVDLFLNTTVNHQAAGAFGIFESPRVPAGIWNQSVFWITGYRGFARSLLSRSDLPAAGALAWPASLALRTADVLTYRRFREDCGYKLERCRAFDDRFDLFWEELRRVNHSVLLGRRTRAELEWHFQYALRQGRVWIWTAISGTRLIAYAIFLRKDQPSHSLKRIRLVDFQTLETDSRILPALLGCALEQCRVEDIHMLEHIGSDTITAALAPLKPRRRRLPSWLYYYKGGRRGLSEVLKNPAAWKPTQFDGDASL